MATDTSIILHFSVIVKTFIKKKGGTMRNELTELGKKIKIALIEKNLSQEWLISEVKKKTGLYFDSSYLNKVMIGKNKNQTIIAAISDILSLPSAEI